MWHTATQRRLTTPEAFLHSAGSLLDTLFSFRESPLVSYSATVMLVDYRRAKAEIPSLMPPEALCVNGCIGNLVFPTADDVPATIYLDKNESFQRQIQPVWQKRQKWFNRDWSRQIKAISTTDSTNCGIQAADLFAWLGNKHEIMQRQTNPQDADRRMLVELSLLAFFSAYARRSVYDYDKIIAAHQRRQRSE